MCFFFSDFLSVTSENLSNHQPVFTMPVLNNYLLAIFDPSTAVPECVILVKRVKISVGLKTFLKFKD